METPDAGMSVGEKPKSYKIEHFSEFDVILNLDYPVGEDRAIVSALLREEPLLQFLSRLREIEDEENNSRFHIKHKHDSSEMVDFILGHTEDDPLTSAVAKQVDTKARYALAGVLSEIILSKRIKNIIASKAVQELVKRWGFSGLSFAEPIMAIIHKKTHKKYLIYKNIKGTFATFHVMAIIPELKKIFKNNKIVSNDLNVDQFLMTQGGDSPHLTLIDTEAYTEATPEGSSRGSY